MGRRKADRGKAGRALLTAPHPCECGGIITTALCAAILSCTASIFALAGSLLTVLALAVLLSGSPHNAAMVAVIAFLVSPLGIPMLVVRLLGGLQDLNLSIKDFIYG